MPTRGSCVCAWKHPRFIFARVDQTVHRRNQSFFSFATGLEGMGQLLTPHHHLRTCAPIEFPLIWAFLFQYCQPHHARL